jgi:D-alanyl-D-alanine dipeptidase
VRAAAALLLVAATARADPPLVDAGRAVPSLELDLRYATANNLAHRPLYRHARCMLAEAAAAALARAAHALAARGLHLVAWDCYRPLSVQRALWPLRPPGTGDRYVADPQKGSRHNRAAAVDVGLADARGRRLPMGSGFDDFSERADRAFAGLTAEERRNRALLDGAMAAAGFVGLPSEWWHFDLVGWERLPLRDDPL